jgi:hypothetical protein
MSQTDPLYSQLPEDERLAIATALRCKHSARSENCLAPFDHIVSAATPLLDGGEIALSENIMQPS